MVSTLLSITGISILAFFLGIITFEISTYYKGHFDGSKGFEKFIVGLMFSFPIMLAIDAYILVLYCIYNIFSL